MGWNSWNKFGCTVDERIVRSVADSIVATGMRDSGYRYVVIDDCWHGVRDSDGVIAADAKKFPSGMKALGDYIHARGLKFGIYSDAGAKTCGGRPGSQGHEYQDALTYARWGVDYLKYDWCETGTRNAEEAYRLMADALRASGRPIVLSLCEWGTSKPWLWANGVGQLWRTTGDIIDKWDGKHDYSYGIVAIADLNEPLWPFAGPGHWNDPDMLEVGNGGLSDTEYRAHFSLWAMMAAPLMAGNDIAAMSPATRDILLNREVIAVDQDALGVQGRRVWREGNREIWVKPLTNGRRAVLLFNRGDTPLCESTPYGTNSGIRRGCARGFAICGRTAMSGRRTDAMVPRSRRMASISCSSIRIEDLAMTQRAPRWTWIAALAAWPIAAHAEPIATIDRNGASVAVEAYAPNIVRVTIAIDRAQADAPPGPGLIGRPDAQGWRHVADQTGDVFTSPALTLTVAAQPRPKPPSQMERYFAPSLPPVSLDLALPGGRPLARMTGWDMVPHIVNGEKTFRVGASFAVTPDEHYYGLGQNQEGVLDLKGRMIECRHDYDAPAGETVCVPFMVTNKGYGIVWDNPSATTVSPGLHNATRWHSNVGERVSFFVIAGTTTDEIYAGYARLTGRTPLPPKAAFGLLQSKARYETQAELTGIADGYRRRGYPLDAMVLDWFHWTRMGQIDIDRNAFPDPSGMNAKLHADGMRSVISVWPRFERESRYRNFLETKGWLLHDKDGAAVDGLAIRSDRAGALFDSTNPAARVWFWDRIRDNILSQGFDYLWLDETEPDLVPDGFFYAIGSGDRFHNLYPLVHTAGVAEGSARDRPAFRNLILARAAYLGAQANGAIFWSSDVQSTWEALRRQVPAGLGFTASGMAYWSSDTGGWQWPSGPVAQHPVLVDPAGATAMAPGYRDYPELFVRWFQYNTFTPTLRIHGQRPATAIWEYGTAAEPILASYLRLRYTLMPYLYSLGRQTYDTGAPFMRALFMDFPNDPVSVTLGDEYMFGPAFLVAPVTEQGATTRRVYLPAGSDWYDYWTERKLPGGQWIDAAAPIDRIPLFIRAGSIVPMGVQVSSTATAQPLESIRVYPGRDAAFTLYDDDGATNAYRTDGGRSATLKWDDATRRLTASGRLPTGQDAAALVRVIGR